MYCCGVTADRSRPKQLIVEKIAIPLVANDVSEIRGATSDDGPTP